jgi:hypothetical protein
MSISRITMVAGILFLFWGCSTSRITHSWKAENVTAKKFNKILVIALNKEPDVRIQEKMENHFAGDLKDLGYNATTSIKEYGPKAFRDMSEEAVVNKIQNSGIDAVITIVLLDKSKERYYVPGHINYSPYAIYNRHFWGYYNTMYSRIYSPGYYTTETRYFWESNLYDMSLKDLLYSVQTESFDPASSESLAHEYGKLIVNDMVKSHVLRGQESAPLRGF